MRKPKICFVTHIFPVNMNDYKGVFVFELAKDLKHQGYEIHVVTPLRPGAKKNEILHNIFIHRYGYFGWRKGRQLGELKGTPFLLLGSLIILGILKCVLVVIKYRVDLLHAYWVVPGGLIAMISGSLTRRPVVSTAAGSDLNAAPKNLITKFFIKVTLKRINHLIAVSTSLKETALKLGLPAKKGTVLPSPFGIDISANLRPQIKKKKNHSPLVIVYVGNLAVPKRVDIILKALHLIQSKNFKVKLDVIGDGNLRNDLEELVANLGLSEEVVFHGAIAHDQIEPRLQKADIFVHCSEMEGLPVAIIEAMVCGLPVIAANVGGIPEVVEHNYNGYLLEPEDVHGFSDGITRLASDWKLREKFSERSLEIVEKRLNKQSILSSLSRLYKELISTCKHDKISWAGIT